MVCRILHSIIRNCPHGGDRRSRNEPDYNSQSQRHPRALRRSPQEHYLSQIGPIIPIDPRLPATSLSTATTTVPQRLGRKLWYHDADEAGRKVGERGANRQPAKIASREG